MYLLTKSNFKYLFHSQSRNKHDIDTYVYTSFYLKLLLYFIFLAMLCLHCCVGYSLAVVSKGCSAVVACGLLVAVASLVVERGLWGARALVVAAHRLSSLWLLGFRAQAQ